MKHEKNKNQAEYNARRKFKSRTLSMSDEDHDKIKSLARSLDVSLVQAVVGAVEEKLDHLR